MKPELGQIVHYYGAQGCSAAIITKASTYPVSETVHLTVFPVNRVPIREAYVHHNSRGTRGWHYPHEHTAPVARRQLAVGDALMDDVGRRYRVKDALHGLYELEEVDEWR